MAFFFRNKAKTDLVKPTKDLLEKLWQTPKLQKVGGLYFRQGNIRLMQMTVDRGGSGSFVRDDKNHVDRDARFVIG